MYSKHSEKDNNELEESGLGNQLMMDQSAMCDFERGIHEWMDKEGIIMSKPIEKKYAYFERVKSTIVKGGLLSLSEASTVSEVSSIGNSPGGNLSPIDCSSLMAKRFQKRSSSMTFTNIVAETSRFAMQKSTMEEIGEQKNENSASANNLAELSPAQVVH